MTKADDLKSKMPQTAYNLFDDCERPACDDMASMLQQAATSSSRQPVAECPPTKSLLGRSSWTLLHTMAAWYPDRPTTEDQTYMRQFVNALARFYPCPWCANDFQENLNAKPVETSSRKELCQWICEQHNLVNEKLGKKAFPCDMKSLDDRWRKSSRPACNKQES